MLFHDGQADTRVNALQAEEHSPGGQSQVLPWEQMITLVLEDGISMDVHKVCMR